jgi:very-short-patch-repair endonuclease
MPKKKTVEEVKQEIEERGELVPDDFEYINDKTLMTIICVHCTKPYKVSRNNFIHHDVRCPCQKNIRYNEARKLPFDLVKERMEIEGYELLSIDTEYKNYRSELNMKCSIGHEFPTYYDNFVNRGRRCPDCNLTNMSIRPYSCRTKEEQKQDFLAVELERNGKYTYDESEIDGLYKEIKFICTIHSHEFYQTPKNHIEYEGCEFCQKVNRRLGRNEIINRIENKFGKDCFDTSKIPNTVLTTDTVQLICLECSCEFPRRITDLIYNNSCGCPECSRENAKLGKEKFVLKSVKMRKKLGLPFYNYDKVIYINNRTNVNIICLECGAIFPQTPDNHLNGCGCPFCRISKGELSVKKFLEEGKIEYIQQYPFERQRFDFYLPKYGAFIEFDGEQHFKPINYFGGKEAFIKNQERDHRKNNYCRGKFPLLRIPWYEYKNIKSIVNGFIKNMNKWEKIRNDMEILSHIDMNYKSLNKNMGLEYNLNVILQNREHHHFVLETFLELFNTWLKLYDKLTMTY